MPITSVNFGFLSVHDPVLVEYAGRAEVYFRDDPRTSILQLRTFAELLAQMAAAHSGVYVHERDNFTDILGRLRDRGITDAQVSDLFHAIRKAGNQAAHPPTPGKPGPKFTFGDAFQLLRLARELGVWFHRAFKDPKYKPGPFVPPPDPKQAEKALAQELERLRVENTKLASASASVEEQARLREEAEQRAAKAYGDLEAALHLAEEATARLEAERAEFEGKLTSLQASAESAPPEVTAAVVQSAVKASERVVLDEAQTRRLIDLQLREAGWETDSDIHRYASGTRPQKGRNVAIAEWPTTSGPADYALFVGLTLIAVVEAKRQAVDVMGALEQGKRYARDIVLGGEASFAGGPWGDSKVPFVFSTNGRAFLQQFRTKSGIWHRDLRRPSNPSVPLVGWKTPEGLTEELRKDLDAAHTALAAEPTDYLGLRNYQIRAIQAVESAIERGDREMLVAMATGTGKTRTCIGLVYRLIKTRRFRRVLFLVDRTSLGIQAADAFKDAKLENFQSFTDIYDVKGLGDLHPDAETKLQFATVQGMVRRLLESEAGDNVLPVDTYDCIVVDESHRGYHLDREMSDAELRFRDQFDYISKYRRVLDHFDAVKVALTATPALHTVEIFGDPVYSYSYREAVVDGFLVDHEPPFRIHTRLAQEGITFVAESEAPAYNTRTGALSLHRLPDEVHYDVETFNRDVVTAPFNKVVCEELADHIDPFGNAKTLVFTVDNTHADLFVDTLRTTFRRKYGEAFEDDLVTKITGSVDRPQEMIRRYRNEQAPNIAVTVDLLTTGVDIPKISNIVFVRRVSSRILYDQMRGRATRLCPEIGKESFRIFDAVGLFDALQDYTDMKPVVANPKIPFTQLVDELATVKDEEAREQVLDQLIAKLQRKKRGLSGEPLQAFVHLAGGEPESVLAELIQSSPDQAQAWFSSRPALGPWLDEKVFRDRWILVSDHQDEHLETVQELPEGKSPDDYLQGFKAFLESRQNDLPALVVVTRRPRELTRKQLRDLRLALDQEGFSEKVLETAWARKTNREVAASIIGFIRQQALGSPLKPYSQRVDDAVQKILSSRPWNRTQRDWLERIGSQLRIEFVVDRDALDSGAFKAKGGFKRIDAVFDGQLEHVLGELHEAVWTDVG